MDYPDSNLLMQHSFEHHWDSETAERWNSDCVNDGESPVFLERFAIVFRSRELFGLNLARCNLCPIRAAVESLSSQIHWLNIGLVQVETGSNGTMNWMVVTKCCLLSESVWVRVIHTIY